jgi:hypothetical protein
MLKFVATSVLGCCGVFCSTSAAMACGGGCCSQVASGCSMNMDMSAPMPDMPGMPGMPAPPQARAGSQYRTYSYQPAPTYYRTNGSSSGGGFNDAGAKVRGGR